MVVYFDNDGTYGQNALHIPVLVNNKPIGFVSEVTEERVTCCLWNRFIDKEQMGLNVLTKEQDIRAISIEI